MKAFFNIILTAKEKKRFYFLVVGTLLNGLTEMVSIAAVGPLLAVAAKKRCKVVKGIDMLIYQGAMQFEIWTGKAAPIKAINSAMFNRLRI